MDLNYSDASTSGDGSDNTNKHVDNASTKSREPHHQDINESSDKLEDNLTISIKEYLIDGVYIVSKIFDRKQHCGPKGVAVRIVLCSLRHEQREKCKIIKTVSSLKLKGLTKVALDYSDTA
uniref:Uncharacterized protein n=1 Tax=Timema bartmani TaxID=61472 RepID=A0A7R9FCL8_9NEOP|nr:unnamed protein product [Timema bartmani]